MLNLSEFFSLTIRVSDYNLVARKPELLQKLRELTLSPGSGLNHELNAFATISKTRPVKAQIILAYKNRKLVGWALLSKEDSTYPFARVMGFKAHDGALFQVYVHPSYRKQGLASKMFTKAKSICPDELCVCPHDVVSHRFYDKFENQYSKVL